MTHIKSLIEKHVGIIFSLALIAGVLFPSDWEVLQHMLTPYVVIILFLSFLGVQISHVREELSRPILLTWQILFHFFLTPLALFFVIGALLSQDFATSAVILSAMPAALAGPALTSIAGGRAETSAVLSVITHILVPFTVTLLFFILSSVEVEIDTLAMLKKLILIVGIPILVAWIARTKTPKLVSTINPYRKVLSILFLAALAYVVIIPYSDTIKEDFLSIIPKILFDYGIYFLFFVLAFFFSFRKNCEEKIAFIISRIYTNAALAIIVASSFFNSEVTLIVTLGQIPWFTTFGLYLWFQKKYIKH